MKISKKLILFVISTIFLIAQPASSNNNDTNTTQPISRTHPLNLEDYPVHIEEVINFQDLTRYTVTIGECKIQWILHMSEEDAGVVQDYSTCTLSLQQQLPFLKKIIKEVVRSSLETPPIRLFAMNFLNHFPVMSIRLGAAVAKSPLWDLQKGQLRSSNTSKDLNNFIKQIANEQLIYPEFQQLFKHVDLQIRVGLATRTKIKPAGQSPYFDQLKVLGIKPEDRIPYNSLFVLSTKYLTEADTQ